MADVIIGADEYLFLGNDSNRIMEQFQGNFPIEIPRLNLISAAHRKRSSLLSSLAGIYIHVMVPNKEVVLSHLLPADYRFQKFGLTPYNLYVDCGLSSGYPSFYRPNHLRRLHEQQPTYARSDTHWTHFGALSYLKECFRDLGLNEEFNALENMPLKKTNIQQAGDLGQKIGKDKEKLISIDPERNFSNTVFDNAITNEGRVRFYRNPTAKIQKKILIHHDSTFEWVINFCRELYFEILAIHLPDCDYKLVAAFRPDVFLFFQIERFFVRSLESDVDILSAIRGQEIRKSSPNSAEGFIAEILSKKYL